MRFTTLIALCALVLAISAPALAAPGDYRYVSGVLAWPAELPSRGLAVIQGDDGNTYFAEVAATDRAGRIDVAPVKAGERVTVMGRDGFHAGQVLSATVQPATSGTPGGDTATESGATPVPQTITGAVDQVSGSSVVLVLADGRRVTVDTTGLETSITRSLVQGQEVSIYGPSRADGTLVAQGVVVDYGSASALPRMPSE